VWSGEASSLVAATTEGEIGILAGHEPVLAVLKAGALCASSRWRDPKSRSLSMVASSPVDSNQVRVLCGYRVTSRNDSGCDDRAAGSGRCQARW
jgi:F0F1-type ATP synthase epsilon subunit